MRSSVALETKQFPASLAFVLVAIVPLLAESPRYGASI